MESKNQTKISEFLLLGFTETSEIQFILFGLFLSMYLVTSTGNILIILAIISSSHLHMPMYFFLSNLSIADFGFTSTTTPELLVSLQTQNKIITYAGCLTNIYFSSMFSCLGSLLLTAMAYYCYVAIFQPLHYMATMNLQICGFLVLGSWCLNVSMSLPEFLTLLRLSCTHVEIPHYFCDPSEVLKLACSGTLINNIFMYFLTSAMDIFPLTGILFSYSWVIFILRILSAGCKHKAFSSCGSHLPVIFLFYSSSLRVYLCSAATPSSRASLVALVLYTMVTPMVNPFIYSLRNREMKQALGTLIGVVATSQ
ncbi:olfactory receptor 7C1-like [Choloepus didactylus]|uniref:olfactory receptor 7C1-like n=1 Tax=Choloepus didactylus TaxID=27675 RepID=UPI00189E9D3C|nr:olfactory receptor 7C1-like [Choloepus didactylus]